MFKTIVYYQLKLLLRSWIVRLFCVVSILASVVIYIENWVMPYPIEVMALPSLLPFKCVWMFNLVCSLFLTCIAGNAMVRSERGDWEALYVRPACNLSWVSGSAIAVLIVVGIVEILVLAFLAFGVLLWYDLPLCLDIYLFYLFTWSLPVIVFWIGITVLVNWLVRARGLRIILLLGIWGGLFFYSSSWGYGIGDFMAREIPNLFSDAVGHANISFYLLHRTCYFLFGCGCFFVAVGGFRRLDNDRRTKVFSRIIGIVLLLSGVSVGWKFVKEHQDDVSRRDMYREALSKYANIPRVHVIQHDIVYQQRGDIVFVKSNTLVEGPEKAGIPEIVFYLNPGLDIREVKVDDKIVSYYRDGMSVILERGIQQQEKIRVEMLFAGRIDESVCYLDHVDEGWNSYLTSFSAPWVTTNDTYRFGGWCAKISDKYTLLHPEIGWYPSAVPFVNPEIPLARELDFTRYSLKVRETNKRVVISQGEKEKVGEFVGFDTRESLSGISLCMGSYECERIMVDSFMFEFYHFPGHYSWLKGWPFSEKEKVAVIRGIRESLEEKYGSSFKFNPFRIVEVPESFTLKRRAWKEETNAVQPGLMFIEERGINRDCKSVFDFFREIPLEDRDKSYWDNLIRHFVDYINGGMGTSRPLFEDLAGCISDPDYPGISLILRQMLTYGLLAIDEKMDQKNSLDIQVVDYMDSRSFRDAICDADVSPDLLQRMIYLISGDLLASWSAEVKTDSIRIFLSDFFRENRLRNVSVNQLKGALQSRFGKDLGRRIDTLYNRRGLPRFEFENVIFEKIDENKIKMAACVVNEGGSEGVLSLEQVQFEGREMLSWFDAIRLQRGERKYCEWYRSTSIIPTEVELKTHLSGHLPFNIVLKSNEEKNSDMIIVDNEDKGFQILEKNRTGKLLSLFGKDVLKESYIVDGTRLITGRWQQYVAKDCYGGRIKSAIGKSEGNGKNRVAWHATLPSDGQYELEVFIPRTGWGWNRPIGMVYFYRVVQQGKIENVSLELNDQGRGWISLGEFSCEAGEVSVELSDRVGGAKVQNGEARAVVADAIRWKKNEK